MDCFQGTGREEMISFLLGCRGPPHQEVRWRQQGMRTVGGGASPSSLALQQARDGSHWEPACDRGSQVCYGAGDHTATSSGTGHRGLLWAEGLQAAARPTPQSQHERGNAQGEVTKVQDSGIRSASLKRGAAARQMCFETAPPWPALCILHQWTSPGEHQTTPMSSAAPQHWPSNHWAAEGPRAARYPALAPPGPHT